MTTQEAPNGYQAGHDKLASYMGNSRPGSLRYRAVAGELARLQAVTTAEVTEINLQHVSGLNQTLMSAVLEAGAQSVKAAQRRIGRNPLAHRYAKGFTEDVLPAYLHAVPQIDHSRPDHQVATLHARGEAIATAQTDLKVIELSSLRKPARVLWRRRAA